MTKPTQPTKSGGDDGFVTKLNPSGNGLLFSTYLGGRDADSGMSVAVDTKGAVHVLGLTSSTDFPQVKPLASARQPVGGDAFVVSLSLSDAVTPAPSSTAAAGSAGSGHRRRVEALAGLTVGLLLVAGTQTIYLRRRSPLPAGPRPKPPPAGAPPGGPGRRRPPRARRRRHRRRPAQGRGAPPPPAAGGRCPGGHGHEVRRRVQVDADPEDPRRPQGRRRRRSSRPGPAPAPSGPAPAATGPAPAATGPAAAGAPARRWAGPRGPARPRRPGSKPAATPVPVAAGEGDGEATMAVPAAVPAKPRVQAPAIAQLLEEEMWEPEPRSAPVLDPSSSVIDTIPPPPVPMPEAPAASPAAGGAGCRPRRRSRRRSPLPVPEAPATAAAAGATAGAAPGAGRGAVVLGPVP